MSGRENVHPACAAILVPALLFVLASPAKAQLNLGPEQRVQADETDILVPGYSVPQLAHWDGDDLPDLIVGQGSGTTAAMVRVYINIGTACDPQFSTFVYAQSNGGDLTLLGSGCLGLFPRVVYWDADARKDLLIGQADGKLKIFLNTGTDENPTFDGGAFVQVGPTGSKTDIDVGARATPAVVDWNNDDKKDLVAGALDGKIHLFLNQGTDTAPDFVSESFAQTGAGDLAVPSARSSPVVLDVDNDRKKDLLAGNTNGQLLFYANVGTDAAPTFSGYSLIESDGVPIDLTGTPRSRPSACDWNDDGVPDVLIGAGDGKIHLYEAAPDLGDFDNDGDVDLDDFDTFEACLGEPEAPVDSCCSPADIDDDGDVDLADYAAFQAAFTGE